MGPYRIRRVCNSPYRIRRIRIQIVKSFKIQFERIHPHLSVMLQSPGHVMDLRLPAYIWIMRMRDFTQI